MKPGNAEHEPARPFALHECDVLETPPEPCFDELTDLAARLCQAPLAGISFVDEHRFWIKSSISVELDVCAVEGGVWYEQEGSFCGHAINGPDDMMVIPDARADPRFFNHPIVTGKAQLRFYAGARVVLPGDCRVGVLWVMDRQVRTLSAFQANSLAILARQVAMQLSLRQANALLSQREKELRLIFETGGEAVYAVDAQGRCTFVNPACLRILGYDDPKALLGKNLHELIHSRRADGTPYPEEECAVVRALHEERESRTDDEVFWRADGEPIWVIYTSSPLRCGARVLGVVVNFVDVTEQRRVREELAEAAHTRERFAGVLGHDLRNPLSTVLVGARLIADQRDASANARATAARVVRAAERMHRLIGDLLDFIRVREGDALPLSRRVTDLAEVARQVVDEFELGHPERRVELETSGVAIGMWDPDRIAQVYSNLIANALQHGAPDQPIRVRVRSEEDCAVLTVENRGLPIPKDLLPHLFDPFRRGRPAEGQQRAQRGLGLGLFIVRQTALAHGGDVTIRSDGRSTVFTVRLALRGEARAAS